MPKVLYIVDRAKVRTTINHAINKLKTNKIKREQSFVGKGQKKIYASGQHTHFSSAQK